MKETKVLTIDVVYDKSVNQNIAVKCPEEMIGMILALHAPNDRTVLREVVEEGYAALVLESFSEIDGPYSIQFYPNKKNNDFKTVPFTAKDGNVYDSALLNVTGVHEPGTWPPYLLINFIDNEK